MQVELRQLVQPMQVFVIDRLAFSVARHQYIDRHMAPFDHEFVSPVAPIAHMAHHKFGHVDLAVDVTLEVRLVCLAELETF